MKFPLINLLWSEEKTRELFRLHIKLFLVGGVATSLYAFTLPSDMPFRTLIVIVPLIFNISAPFYFLAIESKNVGFWFLVFILKTQLLASTFMALTGGFQSVSQFGPFMILIFTLFELGVQATIILSVFTVFTLFGVVLFLHNFSPYPGYLEQFVFYSIAYILVVIIERNIGREISLQFEARDKLKQLNLLKNQFITLTSHYLRTPITIIRGYMETLETDLEESEKDVVEIEDHIDKINHAVLKLQQLLEKLLFISSFVKDTKELHSEPVNFTKLVKNIVDSFRDRAKANGVRLKFELKDSVGVHIFDKKIIAVALEEIIDNAIKFSEEKDEVNVKLSKDVNNLIVEVSDTGVGINKKDLDELFSPFFHANMDEDNYLTHDYEGIGLGLFMANLAVDAYDGNIQVDSVEGEGATFRVIIPQHSA